MSANTWTPTALASEVQPWSGSGWRAVEAQHKVATMALVGGDLVHQAVLEDILEEAKPQLPEATTGLHWLLATPFRYWPLPGGSRFRRRHDPGVFYGAEERQTACAESSYWRLRFWTDSEFLQGQSKSVSITLFEFFAATSQALDLSTPALVEDRAAWMHPSDYSATQQLAEAARKADVEAIRYESVRNPGSYCLALLTPDVFKAVADPYRNTQQSWMLLINPPHRVVWQRELSGENWLFEFAA
ncbi:RES family NAD+ phosphorylase [Aromatoleum toluclasticum]|uniref:RES family NAD+ phosphorylase n=1 Tax=Aromatoleum toluclasticum TaxID=92003 RepID=UPI001D196DBE|nr:RES family NAD+ phosphorylase [Aromatoleum toluclasticum]MCC4114971.1 RES family NAD+ phosphorylase [Aromatoleum toluclasticum]